MGEEGRTGRGGGEPLDDCPGTYAGLVIRVPLIGAASGRQRQAKTLGRNDEPALGGGIFHVPRLVFSQIQGPIPLG